MTLYSFHIYLFRFYISFFSNLQRVNRDYIYTGMKEIFFFFVTKNIRNFTSLNTFFIFNNNNLFLGFFFFLAIITIYILFNNNNNNLIYNSTFAFVFYIYLSLSLIVSIFKFFFRSKS